MKSRAWLIAAWVGLALLGVSVTVQSIWSADFWWQMRNGRWIMEHMAVPREEVYSFTARGTPLREMRWVYCVFIHLVYERVGSWALVLWQAGMIAGALATAFAGRWRVLAMPVGALVVGLALAAGYGRWVMRPELCTFLFSGMVLALLERGSVPGRARLAWLVPLVQVAWVNCHTLFVFGPLLAWGYAGVGVARWVLGRANPGAAWMGGPMATGRLVVIALATTAACWVNPYGHDGAMYAKQMWDESGSGHATTRLLGEMQSPLAMPLAAWTWDLWAGAALALVAGLSFFTGSRRVDLARLGVYGAYLYLACHAQRNVALMVVPMVWVAAGNLAAWSWAPRAWGAWAGRGVLGAVGLLGLAGGWYVATDRYAAREDLPRAFGLGVVEWYQPRGAEAFLLREKPEGGLYNVMRDGSYFIYRVSDTMPVFLDGRTDAYGPAFMDEAAKIGGGNFDAAASKWKLSTAVVPSRGYADVVRHLVASPDWALVYVDPQSLVFVRKVATHERLIAARGGGVERALDEGVPDEVPAAWARALGKVARPARLMGLADAMLSLGDRARAAGYLERALAMDPSHRRARVLLAPLVEAGGDAARAAALLEGLPAGAVSDARREAARLLLEDKKPDAAARALEAALALAPDDAGLQEALGDVRAALGDWAGAKRAYAGAAGTPTAVRFLKLGNACDQLGDGPGTIDALERGLTIDGSSAVAWNMLGGAYGRQGNLARARDCFARALAIQPDYGAARRNLDRVRAMQK